MEILCGCFVLIAVKRPDDWMVHLRGDTKAWDCGPTIEDAVKYWKNSHG